MRKKLLAVLMTGAMVASFAGSATAVFAKSDDDNKLTVWRGIRTSTSNPCRSQQISMQKIMRDFL